MEYFVEIIKALAWPVASIWLGYIFRSEFGQLLNRMSSFKYKDVEASFERKLAEAEDNAKRIAISAVPSSIQDLSQKEQLFRISEISPRAAVVEAWTLIETAAIKNGLTYGTTIQRTNPKMIVEYLINSGKFSTESINLIEQLRKIRNQASHLPDFAISQNEAERYLDLAVQSAGVINAANS